MARDLASIKAFFQGIDDQQSYEQKAAEEERKRLKAEEDLLQAQQDRELAAEKISEWRAGATNRAQENQLKGLKTSAEIDLLSDPEYKALTGKERKASFAQRGALADVAGGIAAGTDIPEAIKAGIATNRARIGEQKVSAARSELNTDLTPLLPALGDPAAATKIAALVNNMPTQQAAQDLLTGMKYNIRLDGNNFYVGDNPTPLSREQLSTYLTNPASGQSSIIQNMIKSAQGAEASRTKAEVSASTILKNEATAGKMDSQAAATDAKTAATTGASAAAPAVIPAMPVAAQAQAKPPTPQQTAQATATAQANQQAMDKIAVLKKAAADATANYQAAHQKYVRLVNGGGSRVEAQQAALERTRLQALMDQAVKAAQ